MLMAKLVGYKLFEYLSLIAFVVLVSFVMAGKATGPWDAVMVLAGAAISASSWFVTLVKYRSAGHEQEDTI